MFCDTSRVHERVRTCLANETELILFHCLREQSNQLRLLEIIKVMK